MPRSILIAVLVLLLLSCTKSVYAQSDDTRTPLNLPSYAAPLEQEPYAPEAYQPRRFEYEGYHTRTYEAETTSNGAPPPPATPEPVPVDGGLALLLAAGAGYGLRKLHRARSDDVQP